MTASPATLLALAASVEAGEGPDRELDARALVALGILEPYDMPGARSGQAFKRGGYIVTLTKSWSIESCGRLPHHVEPVTASVDAALALAKSLLQGCAIDILYAIEPHDSDISHDCVVTVSGLSGPWVGLHVEVKHDNVPRAIVAATLRAVVGRG